MAEADQVDEISEEDVAGLSLCLQTLHRQHDALLQRLDFQDDLLTKLAGGHGRRHYGHQPLEHSSQMIRPFPEYPESIAEEGELSISRPASSQLRPSESLAAFLRPFKAKLFKSYTYQDNKMKREARSREVVSKQAVPAELTTSQRSKHLLHCVNHPGFDVFYTFVVVANAIFVAVDVELGLRDQDGPSPWMEVMQLSFTILFGVELALRLGTGGVRQLWSGDWMWVWLDVTIVASSVWETMVRFSLANDSVQNISGTSSLKAFRLIRVTRMLKTVQLVRVFRYVIALRTLVHSVVHTLKALLWAMLLLLLIVYVFAVLFAQTVHDYQLDSNNPPLPERESDVAHRYFGSLPETMLALFMSIAGGVSWEEPISCLKLISTYWTLLFVFFIAFTTFAVLNVLTAVFCQSAIEAAQKDHTTVVQNMLDNKEHWSHHFRHVRGEDELPTSARLLRRLPSSDYRPRRDGGEGGQSLYE
ncbi:unnamed protein product [Effrenium voratum]|uniref:Ion transport domain-containing protein n=1 Tax=Effrenium voratum TaxID=2562239 RepID=A0AA36JCR1_9DINO|nr:unnamed protein product [Effrenium voratum]